MRFSSKQLPCQKRGGRKPANSFVFREEADST